MRTINSISIIFIISIAFLSCEKSNDQKAKDAIRTYLNENLDDMTSYEPVKFSKLDTLFESLDLNSNDTNLQSKGNNSSKDLKPKTLYVELQMFHSYRIKDGIRKRLIKHYFKLNGKFEVIALSNYTYVNNPYKNNLIMGADTIQTDTAAAY